MKHLLNCIVVICLFIGGMSGEGFASSDVAHTTSLLCGRVRDELTVSLGETEATFFEVITAAPEIGKDNLAGDVRNVASFFIWPVLTKEAQGEGLLFPVLNPLITVSAGKLRNIGFGIGNGTDLSNPTDMTADGLYRFEVEFGRDVPKEFTVVISMTVKRGPKISWSELLCKMTDDGRGQVFSRPDSKLRVLDDRGTRFVFREGKAEMRPDVRGWVSVEVEKQYSVRPDTAERK